VFTTYIIYSETFSKYYVGHTKDIDDRIKRHNSSEGKFTKRGMPWEIKWTFESKTRSEALLLENKIKKRGIKRFLDVVIVRGVAQPG
jgi:putative endonuclease